MSFTAISDIHIKSEQDDRYLLLMKFMESQEVKNSKQIFFLGDIFDLVIGGHPEYYMEFQSFFDLMIQYSKEGKEIRFFEGNHDFHLEGFFTYLQEKQGLKNFYYHKDYFIKKYDGKLYAFSHGDLLDVGNTTYVLWKKLINNSFMKLVTSEIWTYQFVKNLGNYLSNKSRKRNTNKYQNPEAQNQIREIYRKATIRELKQQGWDVFICGHSHVMESYSKEPYSYFNCGYLPSTKSFLHYDGEELQLKSLD